MVLHWKFLTGDSEAIGLVLKSCAYVMWCTVPFVLSDCWCVCQWRCALWL